MLQPACCFLPLVLGVPGVLGVLEVVLWSREVVLRVLLHMLPLAEGRSSWVPVVPRIVEGPVVLVWAPALGVACCLPAVAWLALQPVLGVVR